MRRIRLSARDLVFVLDNRSPGTNHYLDTETGEIIPVFSYNRARVMELVRAAEDRYLRLGPLSGRQGYEIRQRFVATVTDPELRALLEAALVHEHAFRAFREALKNRPEQYRRWKAFHVEQMVTGLRERLRERDIELELVHETG